ncbi:MAG: hypothetical protein ACPGYT_02010 [Nitrospirales bacterium]
MRNIQVKSLSLWMLLSMGMVCGQAGQVMATESDSESATFVSSSTESQRLESARFEEGPDESVEVDSESRKLTIRDSESGEVILSTSLPEESLDIDPRDDSFEIIDEIYSGDGY